MLAIGNIPGRPKSTGATWVFGNLVNSFGAEEKFFVLVTRESYTR